MVQGNHSTGVKVLAFELSVQNAIDITGLQISNIQLSVWGKRPFLKNYYILNQNFV